MALNANIKTCTFCSTIIGIHWSYLKIEKVDVFCKVLNKQFIEKLRTMFVINRTQLHTLTDCFTFWRDHQGDLILFE